MVVARRTNVFDQLNGERLPSPFEVGHQSERQRQTNEYFQAQALSPFVILEFTRDIGLPLGS